MDSDAGVVTKEVGWSVLGVKYSNREVRYTYAILEYLPVNGPVCTITCGPLVASVCKDTCEDNASSNGPGRDPRRNT